MSLCCFPLFRGSRLKKAQSEKSFSCFRRWRKSRHHHLPPPGKIHSQKPIQDTVALADGFTYNINGHGGPVHQARKTVQCQTENSSDDIIEIVVHETHYKVYRVKVQVHQTDTTIQQMSQIINEDILEELVNGFQYSTGLDKGKVLQSTDTSTCCTEGSAEFSFKLREACRIRALQGGALKKLAEFLTPAVQVGNISHLCNFRTMHSYFSQHPVLLLTRATASTVGTWPAQVQGFGKPQHLSFFHLKLALVQVKVPTSEHLCQAHLLCVDLEYPEPQDATPEVPPTELGCTAQLQEGSAQGLVPFSAKGLALVRLGMKQYQKPGCRHLCNEHILRELLNNFNYSTFLDNWRMLEADDTRQCRSERSTGDIVHQLAKESHSNYYQDRVQVHKANTIVQCWYKALRGKMLKNVETIMALNFLIGNISHLTMFNSTHLAFTTVQTFLDDLLSRATASTGGTWPDQVQRFGQPLHLSLFHLKEASVRVEFPTSQQLCEAQLLWANLEYPEPQDATLEDPLPEFQSKAHPQEVDADGLAPGPARCLTLAWPGLMQRLNLERRLLLCFFFLALLGVLNFVLNK